MYDLFDIGKPSGAAPGAGGGIKTVIYAVLADDVDTFPDRGSDLVTISGDFKLNSGKYIHQIYATEKTIEPIEKKLEGENRDSGGYEITLGLFHPGVEAAIQEFKAKHSTSNFYIFFELCAIDRVYLIGEPCNSVYLSSFETKFGKALNEAKGTTFTFMCQQSLPMAIYTGDLQGLLEPDSAS